MADAAEKKRRHDTKRERARDCTSSFFFKQHVLNFFCETTRFTFFLRNNTICKILLPNVIFVDLSRCSWGARVWVASPRLDPWKLRAGAPSPQLTRPKLQPKLTQPKHPKTNPNCMPKKPNWPPNQTTTANT